MDNPTKSNADRPVDDEKRKIIKEMLMQRAKTSLMKGESFLPPNIPTPPPKNESRGPTRVDT
jgi:hypothetical protein